MPLVPFRTRVAIQYGQDTSLCRQVTLDIRENVMSLTCLGISTRFDASVAN